MEVTFQEQKWEIENTSIGVEELFTRITALQNERSLHISHIIIDEQILYNDYREYVEERLQSIEQIQIEAVTLQQYVEQLLVTSHEYCSRAIELLPALSAQYYQAPNQDSWSQFESLLGGLEWLTQVASLIEEHNIQYSNLSTYLEIHASLRQVLSEMLQSVERKENAAIGDLLHYEILPLLEKLEQELNTSLSEEGVK
jgi:hypothetical protein